MVPPDEKLFRGITRRRSFGPSKECRRHWDALGVAKSLLGRIYHAGNYWCGRVGRGRTYRGALIQPGEDEIVAQRMVEHFGQVLPIEDVEKVIDMVDSITRMPCGCRFITTGKTDKRYCFGLGVDKWSILGKFPDTTSSLEVLDKGEAKKFFRRFDREGLVHSIWTGITPYVMGLCNCDRDCGAYKGYIENRGSPRFFRAEYICQVDWDLCTGCKSCMSQCQFGAQFYSSALGKVYIDPRRCFGCGVCRAECSYDAIMLIPRQASPEVANIWLGETY